MKHSRKILFSWQFTPLAVLMALALLGASACESQEPESTDVLRSPVRTRQAEEQRDDALVPTEYPPVEMPLEEAPRIEVPAVEEPVVEEIIVEEPVVEEAVEEEPAEDGATGLFGYEAIDPVFGLPGIKTEHYSIYSQMSDATTYDIALRVEALYDYYADRFEDEYYPIDFPKLVFLFSNREDFVAAGGHPTMPGLFMGGHDDTGVGARFMMITHDGDWGALSQMSCPLMYHEAFHQFVALEISQAGNTNRDWPTFMDEGHGTLFNNLMWTGDGFVDGTMTLSYLYSAVENRDNFITFDEMLNVTGERWHELLAEGRVWAVYMQSMSVLHFLYNANDGEHRELIETYVNQVSTDANGEETQKTADKIAALEDEFYEWFEANMVLSDDLSDRDANGDVVVTPNVRVTGAKFYEAMTAMAMSHVARTYARGQEFESGQAFFDAAVADELDMAELGDSQWLPDTLRQEMVWWHERLSEGHGPIEIELGKASDDGLPVMYVTQPRFGLVLKGTFSLDEDGNVADVSVEYIACPSMNLIEAEAIVEAQTPESEAESLGIEIEADDTDSEDE